ncbi:MAG TPA: glycosyltransferase family 87 protein [Gemmatimonadales bacterium]|nr:glycosyltransferase family 87 protein [Gemmatimonadales bacterium]
MLPRDPWPRLSSERAQRGAMIALYALVLAVALAEALRALGRMEGVIFSSYLDVGNAVLSGSDPYALSANTWPPFFALESVPLALVGHVSPHLALFLWQLLGLFATWGVVKLSVEMFEDGPITFWPVSPQALALTSSAVIVPFLMTARLFDEHAQHTQINVQVLWLVLWGFHHFRRARPGLGGLALAFAASTKVVPVLLVLYLLYKRCWREAAWTLVWLVLLNVVVIGLVFGPSDGMHLWSAWHRVAGRELSDPTPTFMNQSLLAGVKRAVTPEGGLRDPVSYHITSWSLASARTAFMVLAGLVAGVLAWLFRNRPGDLTGPRAGGELALCLGAMAVVDPLAWKAHYVVLITAYAFCWWALRKGGAPWWQWALWWGSLVCLTGSAAAIWGGHFSHVLESYDVILAGALMLLVLVARRVDA